MNYFSQLRSRLKMLLVASALALSLWVIDYVVLPPIWSVFTVTPDFTAQYIAAAQETLPTVPMNKIPAGSFWRGYGQGLPDERVEQLIFTDEFYIDRYEVTERDYQQCVAFGVCEVPRTPPYWQREGQAAHKQADHLPVTWITWQDAQRYCQFLHKRLPTEAEWEKAARGPDAFLYPWGNDALAGQAHTTHSGRAVVGGAFLADRSYYGVYDLAANVREWVADWYQWDYYTTAPQQNPVGADQGDTKVVRGGSWRGTSDHLRATRRANVLPTTAEADLGFRCASSTFPPMP